MPSRSQKKRTNKYDKYDITNPINQPIQAPPPTPKLKKIAVCGTACQGKSTLIRDMIKRWPQLTTPEKSYRDVIREKGLTINKDGGEESQKIILDVLIDQAMADYGKQKIILDRCPLDNLVYSIWLNDKHPERMSDEAVAKTITLVYQSMKFLDAIFFIPLTNVHKVLLVPDQLREVDPVYVEEIDNIFKAVINTQKLGIDKFFPIQDCPPIIEVFGDRETRIKMLELYINDSCEFVDGDDSVMSELAQHTKDEHNLNSIITQPTK